LKTLESGVFRKKFDEKGRLSAWLSEIPVKVITANDAALRGAAFALSEKYPMATVNC
jgi:glucokinase